MLVNLLHRLRRHAQHSSASHRTEVCPPALLQAARVRGQLTSADEALLAQNKTLL